MKDKVRVGLVGSGFISAIHADALKRCAGAEIVAVASPTRGKAGAFAGRHGIPRHFTDYRKLLDLDEIDLVVLGIPNDLHCEVTLNAAAAGKRRVHADDEQLVEDQKPQRQHDSKGDGQQQQVGGADAQQVAN